MRINVLVYRDILYFPAEKLDKYGFGGYSIVYRSIFALTIHAMRDNTRIEGTFNVLRDS